MGVHLNIYCIPKQPHSVDWSKILETLSDEAMIRGPYRAGGSYRLLLGKPTLRTPENFLLVDNGADAPQPFERIDHAVNHIDQKPIAMVAVEALAPPLRREPESFYSYSADLGLYRFHDGHTLTVGQPEDPDLISTPVEPKWRAEVFEFLWIHGKNAPLEEDFIGSPMHGLIERFWPGHSILADEFL